MRCSETKNILLEPPLPAHALSRWDVTAAINMASTHLSRNNMGLWGQNLHPAADSTSSSSELTDHQWHIFTDKTCSVTQELWFIAFSWEICLRCRLFYKLRARSSYWSCTETNGLLLCIGKWSFTGAINYYQHPWKSSLQCQNNPGRGSCRDPQEKLSCDCAECSTHFIISKIITHISQKAKQISPPPALACPPSTTHSHTPPESQPTRTLYLEFQNVFR